MNEDPTTILIRPAQLNDAEAILRWRNDPQTRKMSRNDALIDDAAHERWFDGVLGDPDRLILIGDVTKTATGMVRFDRQRGTRCWEISIILAPERRAKGMGKLLLTSALSHFFAAYPETRLLAEIKHSNIASQRLFTSLGFLQHSSNTEMLQFVLSHE